MRRAAIRSWWPLAVLLAAAAVSLALACNGGNGTEQTIQITFTTPTPTPVPTASPTPAPTPTPTPSPDVCGANPDPAPESVLQVEEPQPGERVPVPFHLRGWGSTEAFQEIGVAVAVIDADQSPVQVLDPVPAQPRAFRTLPPGLANTEFASPFAADIQVTDLAGPTPFCIWVFLETDEEGTPKDVVQVPIVVAP